MLTAPFCKLVLGTDQQTPKLTTGILMPTEVPALRNRTIYTTHFYYGWSFDMMAYAGCPQVFFWGGYWQMSEKMKMKTGTES